MPTLATSRKSRITDMLLIPTVKKIRSNNRPTYPDLLAIQSPQDSPTPTLIAAPFDATDTPKIGVNQLSVITDRLECYTRELREHGMQQ